MYRILSQIAFAVIRDLEQPVGDNYLIRGSRIPDKYYGGIVL